MDGDLVEEPLQPGRELGHYVIRRLLGAGGMGEVYEAEDRRLGRLVALKILPRGRADSGEGRARFEREAHAVASLQHPNIVTVHALEEIDGHQVLVMERVDGEPLSEHIPAGGMALERFLDLALPLTEAVAAAHGQGISHRDLKPANVLIDRQGRVRVLDFGLAKWVAGAGPLDETAATRGLSRKETLTGEGKIVGTVAYMSPEQAEGKAVDHRSDIFSLGVVLFQMATGRLPFEGDTSLSLISSILRDEPSSVTDLRPGFPRYAARIVRRCLQKDPARRYQTVLDLRNDLLELQEDLASGVLDAPPEPARGKSRGTLWMGLGLVAALALVATAVALLGDRDDGRSEERKQVRPLVTRGRPTDAALSPDGRYVAYVAVGDQDRRSLRLLQVRTGSDLELIGGLAADERLQEPHFAGDGEHVYFTRARFGEAGALWRVPILGGAASRLLDGIAAGAEVSPDGRWIAAVRGTSRNDPWNNLEVVAADDGSRRSRLDLGTQAEVWSLAWMQDGETLVVEVGDRVAGRGSGLFRLAAGGGELRPWVARGEFRSFDALCPQPDGSVLVSATRDLQSSGLWRIAPDGGAALVHGDYLSHDGCSSSAAGDAVVTIRNDYRSELWVLPVDGSEEARPVATTTGGRDGAGGVAWRDADTLVYDAYAGGSWELFEVDLQGGPSRQLTRIGAGEPTVVGDSILFSGGFVEGGWGIFELEPGERPTPVSPTGILFEGPPTGSPDGRWVFYNELLDEGMRLVARARERGGEGAPLRLLEGTAHLVHYSPDGGRLNLHLLGDDGAWKTAIYTAPEEPTALGSPESLLDLHSELTSPWLSDSSILHARTTDGARNLFEISVETLEERPVTRFRDGGISAFALSPDRRWLVVARSQSNDELLLIEDP